MLTISLMAGAAIQGGLLYAYWTGGWRAYGTVWARVTPFSFAVSMAFALEALSAMARHFPKALNLSMALLATFGILTAAAVTPLSSTLDEPMWLLAVRTYWKLGAFGVLLGTRLFLGWVEPAMRRNVRLYVAGALVCMAGSAAGDIIIKMTHPNFWGIAVGQFSLLLLPIFGYLQWARISREGEAYTATPHPTLEQIDEQQARVESDIRHYRAADR